MYEFFSNLWRWVLEHSTGVLTFITSSSFVTAVTSVVLSMLSRRGTKENTAETRKLSALMKQNETLAANVGDLTAKSVALSDKMNETLESMDTLVAKVNALLEVEYVRAAAISNVKTRTDVNSIINNVRYAETRARAKIAAENEQLKLQIAKFAEAAAKSVDTVNKIVAVESSAGATEPDNPVVMRG